MAASDNGADVRGPPAAAAAADLLNSLVLQAFESGELTPRLQINTRRRTAPPTFVHATDRIQLLSLATERSPYSRPHSGKACGQLPTTPPTTPRQLQVASEGGAAATASLHSLSRPAVSMTQVALKLFKSSSATYASDGLTQLAVRPKAQDTVPRSHAWTGSWALAHAPMHTRALAHSMAAADMLAQAAAPVAGIRPLLPSRPLSRQAPDRSPASATSPFMPPNTPDTATRSAEATSAAPTSSERSYTWEEWPLGTALHVDDESSPRAVLTSSETRSGTSALMQEFSHPDPADAGPSRPSQSEDSRETCWQGLPPGGDPFIDDAIRRQVELLLQDKARLAEENRRLKSENQSLQDLLLIQEEMMLQEPGASDRDDSEEEDRGRDQEQERERDGPGRTEKADRVVGDRWEEAGGATPLSVLTMQPCM